MTLKKKGGNWVKGNDKKGGGHSGLEKSKKKGVFELKIGQQSKKGGHQGNGSLKMGAYWQAHAAGSSWECHPPPAAYPPFSSSLTFSYFSLIKQILILIQKTYLESRIIKLAQNWCSWTKNSSVATSWIRKRWEKCNVSHYFDVRTIWHMTKRPF